MKQEIIHEVVLVSFCIMFASLAFVAIWNLKNQQNINKEYGVRIIKFLQEMNKTNAIIQTPEEYHKSQ